MKARGARGSGPPEGRQRPLRSDAQQNRARLLAAARDLVSESGPEALTVSGVARRAGLNRSTAYQHFRDREQLVEAVGNEFARDLHRMFSEPRDFGAQVDFFVDYFQEHPDIARIWLFRLLSGESVGGRGWKSYVAAFERLAKSPRSQAGIDAEMLAAIAMTSAMVWSLMSRGRSSSRRAQHAETSRFAREFKRLFLHGALRPEAWPELAEEIDAGEAASQQQVTPRGSAG